MDRLLYGSAYYDEYMPTDRIATDVEMMTAAGHNVVRIAESTWSTLEPQPGVFDFTHVDRAIDAMEAAGISVIVGTPTYAVPTWLAASHPEVLTETSRGEPHYGARQIMDITHPAYLFHAERVIRELMRHTARRPAVIGFQIDNETKYYDAVSPNVQRAFVKHLRERFGGDLDALNRAFGLDYWSNRVNAWEDFPDVRATINASLGAAFDAFRRGLVEDFLGWQAGIVREYARDDQFVTQNFDFDWGPGWSHGIQPYVDHFSAARTVDIAGVDIYHPTQSRLTGAEIAFGGDVMRSVKGGRNYLVLETQAQGQMGWLPYPGQLRLQAYSHLASGADGVMYWHWHSIHHSFETYWKGVLSHDLESNPVYEESGVVGREWAEHSASLLHLRKRNRVAVMVSNEALTALRWFGLESGFVYGSTTSYNDVVRWIYDALFELNVEVDVVNAESDALGDYALIVVPALYSAPQETIDRLRSYVEQGGHIVATFRSFVADENVEVWHDRAPHGLVDVFGATYSTFSTPDGARVVLDPDRFGHEAPSSAEVMIELVTPTDADTLASYEHPAWSPYAAITRNAFGAGEATYIATRTGADVTRAVLSDALHRAGVWDWPQELSGSVRVRRGVNGRGNALTYLLNYSGEEARVDAPVAGTSVLKGSEVAEGQALAIPAWDLAVIETPSDKG